MADRLKKAAVWLGLVSDQDYRDEVAEPVDDVDGIGGVVPLLAEQVDEPRRVRLPTDRCSHQTFILVIEVCMSCAS